MIWISTNDELPPDETPVQVFVKNRQDIGAIFWEKPGFEDTHPPFRYWDNPEHDGQDWEWSDVTHWHYLEEDPK